MKFYIINSKLEKQYEITSEEFENISHYKVTDINDYVEAFSNFFTAIYGVYLLAEKN